MSELLGTVDFVQLHVHLHVTYGGKHCDSFTLLICS